MKPVRDGREGALALLHGVLADGTALSDLTGPHGPLAPLPPPARAEAQRLALACLRHLGALDAALAPMLRRPPEPALRLILRLAATELSLAPDAAHAIVHAAVAQARQLPGGQGKSGFVNAVLRKLSAAPEALLNLSPQRLPQHLRAPIIAAWGKEAATACEAAHAAPTPPLDITLRDPSDAAAWAARLEAEVLPTGSLRRPRAGQVSALPGYEAGAWWVQDAAAALPARMLAALGDLAGKRVLDLCAAPGGKTLQLAALGAQVTALDISGPRLQRLAENLTRTGLQANPIAADALTWQPEGAFDAILLDAPCSATGTIRRHPDLPFLRSAADIEALTALQAALIDRAAGWLKPGGVMVYATCSLMPAEGEAQIDAALARLPDLRAAPLPLPGGLPETARAPQGALRLLPAIWAGRGGIDGFYIAGLQRA